MLVEKMTKEEEVDTFANAITVNSAYVASNGNGNAHHKITPPTITDKFVFAEDVQSVLDIGFATKTNVILYGPGGHGKSEMIKTFFESKGLRYDSQAKDGCDPDDDQVIVLNIVPQTPISLIYGGIDLAKLEDDKKITYFFQRSMFNYKYAVLEEGLDNEMVIEALKHALISKRVTIAGADFDSRLEFVVIATNKSPEEILVKNGASLAAARERFPLELNVKWESYTKEDYMKMFRHLKVENPYTEAVAKLSEIATAVGTPATFVSPRTAVYANDIASSSACQYPLQNIQFMIGYNKVKDIKQLIEQVLEEIKIKLQFLETVKLSISEYDSLYSFIEDAVYSDTSTGNSEASTRAVFMDLFDTNEIIKNLLIKITSISTNLVALGENSSTNGGGILFGVPVGTSKSSGVISTMLMGALLNHAHNVKSMAIKTSGGIPDDIVQALAGMEQAVKTIVDMPVSNELFVPKKEQLTVLEGRTKTILGIVNNKYGNDKSHKNIFFIPDTLIASILNWEKEFSAGLPSEWISERSRISMTTFEVDIFSDEFKSDFFGKHPELAA